MRKIRIYLFTAAVLGMIFSVSCARELPEGEGTASVTLSIGLPGAGLGVDEGPWTKAYVDASQYEGMRTLRIVVTSGDPGSRTILYNQKVEELDNALTHQLTISELPYGELTFYAIVNEESLGMTYDDATITDNLNANHKLLFQENGTDPKHFPRKGPDIVQYGLPMTGFTTINVEGDTQISMDVVRSVVKLAMTVENATNSDITLNNVQFGEFFSDRFYMFRDMTLDVPDGTQYSSLSYDNQSVAIPANSETEKLSLYFYPTHPEFESGNSPFTIGIVTADQTYGAQVFAPNTAFFIRNTQVNLRVRITTTVGITLEFEVKPWDEYTVDVPSFN